MATVTLNATIIRTKTGIEATMQFAPCTPNLLAAAKCSIAETPHSSFVELDSHTLLAFGPIPWELIQRMPELTPADGITADFVIGDQEILAEIVFPMSCAQLAAHMAGKAML